jgi:hypothetical protein
VGLQGKKVEFDQIWSLNVFCLYLMSLQGGFAHDQGAGWMDVLFIEEPPRHEIGLDSSVVYATKSVDFEGSTLTLRSGFVHVGFQPKPRKSQGMYALMSWILDFGMWSNNHAPSYFMSLLYNEN